MSSRVGSAALALTATVLIALSITPIGHAIGARGLSSWWSGHPTIEERESHLFKIHVGLVKSAFCYVDRHGGGVRECTAEDEQLARDEGRPMTCGCGGVPLGTGFRITKYVTFGFALLLLVGLVATTLAKKRRATAGKVVLVGAAVSSILTIVVLAMGPAIAGVDAVPLSLVGGLGLYFVGVALSIVTGLLALRPERPAVPGWAPTLPSRPSQNPMMHAPMAHPGAAPVPPSQPFDVHALLQEDALRPAALGPEPQLGRPNPSQLPPSPGGALPGPSGPLAPPSGPQPLFSSAPQLRPLYEVQGSAPTQLAPPQPPLPARGPTPLPMSAVDALTGQPSIPPSAPHVPPLPSTIPAVAPPAPPARPKTLPPPLRNKPASVAPPLPIPPRAFPTAPPPVGAPKPTMMSNAVVPPPRDVPPPAPPKLPPPKPPLPKPPGGPIHKPGATLMGPVAGYALPRAATDPAEHAATEDFEKATLDRDFDGMATAALEKPSATELHAPAGSDRTDPAAFAVESTLTATPFESEVETHVTPPADEGVETSAAPKVDPLDATHEATQTSTAIVDAPTRTERPSARVSAAVLTSATRTTPPPMAAARQTGPQSSVRATGAQQQVPISTAPDSLPPPKEDDEPATAIGPTPACPQCEAPMGWVEEHLRFYCKSCRMYF